MKTLISVIIPTFKRRNKIEKAIRSLILQKFQNWEAIIIDNNSNDGTKEFVKGLKDDRFRFYEIENHGIISKSRNYGIQLSRSNYIAFLDSDDWWSENKLSLVKDCIAKGSIFIFHNHWVCKMNSLIKKRKFISRKLSDNIYEDLLNFGPNFATSSVVVEKKKFIEIGCFDENEKLISWEDYDAWLKFAKCHNKFTHINELLSYIRIDDNNNLTNEKIINNINSFYKKYLEKKNLILPNWCNIELTKSLYYLKNYSGASEKFSKIDFKYLNFKQKIKIFIFYVLIKFKFLIKI